MVKHIFVRWTGLLIIMVRITFNGGIHNSVTVKEQKLFDNLCLDGGKITTDRDYAGTLKDYL